MTPESPTPDKKGAMGSVKEPELAAASSSHTENTMAETHGPSEIETLMQNVSLDDKIPAKSDHSVASAVHGGREVSSTVLYVGNIPKTVSEQQVLAHFSTAKSAKLLNDKNHAGFLYAFVDFPSGEDAQNALTALNGSEIAGSAVKINRAFQLSAISTITNTDTPLYTIFVGDLSAEIDDEALGRAFDRFSSRKMAHVMWDMQTSRSRGYGFVSFLDPAQAEAALVTMSGQTVGGRAIRCNWASHRQPHLKKGSRNGAKRTPSGSISPLPVYAPQGYPKEPPGSSRSLQQAPNSFELVLHQSPSWQTTVYLGNIAHYTQLLDLVPLLQNFGYIVDFKLHPGKGCAFAKFDSHERAALAIVQLAGFAVNGRPLRCGWGRDRPTAQFPAYSYPQDTYR